MSYPSVGDVVLLDRYVKKYVVISKIDHAAKDIGACYDDLEFKLCPLEYLVKTQGVISDIDPLLTIVKINNNTNHTLDILQDEAPFEIKPMQSIKYRRKQERMIREWV